MLADSKLLDFNATLFFQLLIFLLTAAALWRFAWGPITKLLEARRLTIENGLKAAEESEKRLTVVQEDVRKLLDEARGQAREIVSRAHQEATADAEQVRTRSRREAEAQVERARADIAVERDRALTELRTQVGALVVAAAGQVLGEAIDAKAHSRLIEESLRSVTAQNGGGELRA
ncbi:MAG: F0F1 ATP synthase subunit B [Candidatus Dormibacteria bacterium]